MNYTAAWWSFNALGCVRILHDHDCHPKRPALRRKDDEDFFSAVEEA